MFVKKRSDDRGLYISPFFIGGLIMTDKEILDILFPDDETSIGQMEEYEETIELLSQPDARAELERIAREEMEIKAGGLEI